MEARELKPNYDECKIEGHGKETYFIGIHRKPINPQTQTFSTQLINSTVVA